MNAATKSPKEPPEGPLPNRAAGQRLARAIHVARAKNTQYTSDAALAIAAGVHYDTFMNWFSGKTLPRPFYVRKVATVLGVPFGDLLAEYEGAAPPEQPLHEAVRDLAAQVAELVETQRQGRAAQDRMVAEALRAVASILSPAPDSVPVMNREPVRNGR